MEILVSDFFIMMENPKFVSEIKKNISKGDILIVPTSDDETVTKYYANKIVSSFNKNDIVFDNIKIYQSDFKLIKSENVSLTFLMGGSFIYQNSLIWSDPEFVEFLKKFTGLMIGYSAGALNLGTEIYLNPIHGEKIETKAQGLGRYTFYLDVHRTPEVLEKTNYLLLKNDIYLLDDNSAIICSTDGYTFIGNVKYINNLSTHDKK